mgnify:CR=1 FL=1
MQKTKKRKQYYKSILQNHPIYDDVLGCMEKADKESLYNLVFMPVLVEFVSWVLEEAQKSKKKRLYFLARDGYQMYLVARRLCKTHNIPVECRYLNVSRYSMRMPEYHLLKEKCVDYICTGGIDVTIERIMKRAGLEERLAQKYISSHSSERLLNYKEIQDIKEELQVNAEFLEEVYQVSKSSYKPALQYLKQEGLMDGISFALVDSGWVGTLQQSISHLIDRPDLEGYYFGLYEIPKNANKERYHSFYFGPKDGILRKVDFSNCLFESIFTSPEGMTIGYEYENQRFVPKTDFHKNPNETQVTANCEHIENYMDIYKMLIHNHEITHGKLNPSKKKRIALVEKLLVKAMGYPTTWEVETYGDWLFSDDVLEGNLKKVAAELTTQQIHSQRFVNKALIMLGKKDEELHESAWLEGSIVRNGESIYSNLFHAKLYKLFVYIRKLLK